MIELRTGDPDGWFGEEIAEHYDDDSLGEPGALAATVDTLHRLAAGGPALEFAIGTGRVALPLAARGVPVHGIELSRAMVARLRAKPGGDAIPVTIGDMATTRVEGGFALAYLVFNTIGNLTSQDAQVACFENAAAHLRPGGRFVVEIGVPGLRLLPPGQVAAPFRVDERGIGYDVYDCATQAMSSHHVTDGVTRALPFRYVWPAELDLMARIAGMRLEHRWEDWAGTPFGHESTRHVSVWHRV